MEKLHAVGNRLDDFKLVFISLLYSLDLIIMCLFFLSSVYVPAHECSLAHLALTPDLSDRTQNIGIAVIPVSGTSIVKSITPKDIKLSKTFVFH